MLPTEVMHLQLTRDKPAADEHGLPGLAMELVLPGVTVPWAHALYLWSATAVSLGAHEVTSCLRTPFTTSIVINAHFSVCHGADIPHHANIVLIRHLKS